jgi:hypothetical protein
MKKLVIILLGLGLIGCTTVYYRAGTTQTEFDKDSYECKQQAYSAMSPLDNMFITQDMYHECMRVRGYVK